MVWKDKFSAATLQVGREFYELGQVENLKRTQKGYEAQVGDRHLCNVKIGVKSGRVTSLYCDCPESKLHAWCSHVAAVLYTVEEIGEEQIPMEQVEMPAYGDSTQEGFSAGGGFGTGGFADDPMGEDSYAYFRLNSLRESLDFSDYLFLRGQNLINDGKIKMRSFQTEYTFLEREMIGVATASVQRENKTHLVQLVCGPEKVFRRLCDCPECASSYYSRIGDENKCVHLAALFLLMQDYLRKENVGDATDWAGNELINAFHSRRVRERAQKSDSSTWQKNLELEPRVLRKDGEFLVDFRIGSHGGKNFLIKDLSRLVRLVEESGDARYGATMIINHNIRNFTSKSQEYIAFIRDADEEGREELRTQYENSLREQERLRGLWKDGSIDLSHYEYIKSLGRVPQYQLDQQIRLEGQRLDQFYTLAESSHIAYEERGGTKKKSLLLFREKNPQITMQIAPFADSQGGFQGLEMTATLPELIRGKTGIYYMEETSWNRLESEFVKALEPFLALAKKGAVSFRVGRHQMQSFYYTVLPKLGEYLDIEYKNEEVVRKYLLPDVKFVFYLDAEEGEATCRALVRYGEQEFSLKGIDCRRSFRDSFRENEALEVVHRYFSEESTPFADADLFYCSKDGEALYRLLADGVKELMKLGEVQSSDGFRKLRLIERPKFSFAVSLHSGLLDLNISSDDISREELLEVLHSYRQKKSFHRLKNGDFLSLDSDSYFVLNDLFETLQISPKEFVAGNMHMPAYRALYLNKMLEGQETVYAKRDTHFRELICNFRTVQNADYLIPESLRPILREYQKTGYRWLRTLQSGHFGGILADDMGLGKTLQVISVLLACKEEREPSGRIPRENAREEAARVAECGVPGAAAEEKGDFGSPAGPALIVCPASLVYNWGEEFERYAPVLSICYVTGTQTERHQKISAARDYDVLITSYDLLKRDIDAYENIEFGFEVIDEAQYIKNYETAAAKAVKLIRAGTRYALTGTPIENRLSELWSIFDYLMPGFLYPYKVFRTNYELRIMKDEDEEAAARLRRLISPFILRRLKKDVLKDLPDKIEETRYVRFEEEQQKLYDAQVVHMRQMVAQQDPAEFQKNRFEILKELTRIRQICCDPALCFEQYDGGSAKLESCLDLIVSAIEGGHRMLLFSQFTTMLTRIKNELDVREIRYYEITGSTPKEKRLTMVREFNGNDVPVFLISLKAGGTGLNLTGADVVIHYDPWWNVAVQNQATDRAHRIGQEKIVTVYKLIAKGTIEEKIQKLQESKQDLADQIISGNQGASLSSMTQEELLELLG